MRFLLVLNVEDLPLFLKGRDQFCSLLLRHQVLPAVFLGLFLDLHLANQVVLVLDLVFDVGQVLRCLSVGLLLEEILVLIAGQFRRCRGTINKNVTVDS